MAQITDSIKPSGRYTVSETCIALGIHRTTLDRLCKRGAIRKHWNKYTGKPHFRGADILKFVGASL